LLLEKGLLLASATPGLRDYLQGGLVPLAPHPRGYADRRADAYRRSRRVVEVDQTYIGHIEGVPKPKHLRHKNVVMTLVERDSGARSFHLDGMAISDIMPILRENVAKETQFVTDEAKSYYDVSKEFAGHDTVNHSREEYVRYTANPNYVITTNTVEGFYSIFKRGMKGVYQHCSEKPPSPLFGGI
jgi:hypothetical protein